RAAAAARRPCLVDGDRFDVASADRPPRLPGADHELGAGVARGVAANRRDRHQHARLPPRPQVGDRVEPGRLRHGWGRAARARARGGRPGGGGVVPRPAAPPKSPASGVGGQPRSTLVPAGPNAAAACRSASRTEKASISGGSPTALAPYTAPSSVAFLNSVTLKTSGISEKLGSLEALAPC